MHWFQIFDYSYFIFKWGIIEVLAFMCYSYSEKDRLLLYSAGRNLKFFGTSLKSTLLLYFEIEISAPNEARIQIVSIYRKQSNI